ncbi:MAG: DNA circularization protein [Aeromonas veronii]
MAWRDELRPGSFRGVPFLVESSDEKLGRRAVQTEYPGRDEPYPEDMGRKAWSDALKVFVLGDDHLQQAASLKAALNEFGPGELVHPYWGTMQVQIGEVSLSHSSREGGKSSFSIEVMEAGQQPAPSAVPVTDAKLAASTDDALTTLVDDFMRVFSIADLPQGLIDELAVRYNDAMNLLAPVRGSVSTVLDAATQIRNIAALLADPQALVEQLLADVFALFGLPPTSGKNSKAPSYQAREGASVERIQDVLSRLPSVEATRLVPANLTPSRKQQVITQGQILDLLQGSVVITSGLTSSQVEYRDREQAADVQRSFEAALERVELKASDALYETLQQVKVDMVADLSGRGAGLPSVTRVMPERTLPALVHAYRLYQDATRADQLSARNNLDNPLFVPAKVWMEVVQ